MMVEETPKGSISEDKTSINPTTNTNLRLLRDGDEVDDEPEEGEIVCEHDSESSNPSKGLPHALEYPWTFWFDNTSKSKPEVWGVSMREIYTFTTIEDFWGIYNNICCPSKLPTGADFYCFKKNIEPKWEDPVCANGGKWTMTFPKVKSDTCWLYTLLAMIGEQFEHGDDICGAVVNVRLKHERISIWTKNASNKAAQIRIGKQWKEFVDYNESIGFIFHEDSIRLERSAKDKYTI